MRRAASQVLRRASAAGAACDQSTAAGAAAAPAAALASKPLERFRERLAAGPVFDDFVSGKDLSAKEGYSVAAPPLKARRAAPLAARHARADAGARRLASPSRSG